MAEKSFNLRVADLRKKLVDVVNEAALPVTVSAMILREFSDSLNVQANNQVLLEIRDRKQAVEPAKE